MMELLKRLFHDIRECRLPWQALRVMTYIAAHQHEGYVRVSQRALRPFCNVSNRYIEVSVRGLIELDYIRPLTDAKGKVLSGMFSLGWRTVKYEKLSRRVAKDSTPVTVEHHNDTPEHRIDTVDHHNDTPEHRPDTVEHHPRYPTVSPPISAPDSQICDTVEHHNDTVEHHLSEDPPQEPITGTVLGDLQAASEQNVVQPLQLREESATLLGPKDKKSNLHELIPGQIYIPLDFEDDF